LFSLLAGAASVGMAFDRAHHDYGKDATMAVLALVLGYLACRELAWLRGPRRRQRLQPAA